MKTTLLIFFCLFVATAAFGQYGGVINSQPQFYPPPDHPAHASYAPMATEQSVVGGTAYATAQGDRPASDFPQKPQASLGDVARELRKQHEHVKKARIVWTN
ncbi:MAG: hypothetical protein WAL71_13510 [Terriglobales bacterium]|jgi:hypothetical protein